MNLGTVPAKKDEGWADDEPQQSSGSTAKAESESSNEYEKIEHEDATAK